MTLGNMLTAISILVAFVSFAYNSNKRIFIYKFIPWRITFVVCVFLLLTTYLLMFDWVEANGFYFQCFMHEGNSYPLPCQWAYIITIIFLIYICWKTFISKNIPSQNYKGLLAYYEELILSDIPLLVNYIRKYHLKEIEKMVDDVNHISDDTSELPFSFWGEPKKEQVDCEYDSLLQRIILKPSFIKGAIRHYYSLQFLQLVHNCTNKNLCGLKEAVSCYYCTLLQEKNEILTDAIINTSNFIQDGKYNDIAYRLYEYEFSKLTFSNLEFVCNLEVWHVFGEEGLQDATLSEFFHTKVSEWTNAEYKKHPAKLCLRFYDILMRQIIYEAATKGNENNEVPHIYPFYLYLIFNAMAAGEDDIEDLYVGEFLRELKLCIWDLLEIHHKTNLHHYYFNLLNIVKALVNSTAYSDTIKIEIATWAMECYIEVDSLERINSYFKDQWRNIIPEMDRQIRFEAWKGVDSGKYNNHNYPNIEAIKQIVLSE